MRRFESHTIGIDEGDAILFSDFEHDGPMWTGEGPRLVRKAVQFSESFMATPSVQLAPSMWDISNKATARIDLRAEIITEIGFEIVLRTWGDTRIARMRVAWRAIGAVSHPDNWQLH